MKQFRETGASSDALGASCGFVWSVKLSGFHFGEASAVHLFDSPPINCNESKALNAVRKYYGPRQDNDSDLTVVL
jgi:hypothetical protein